jgi:integrase-like protein
MDSEAPEIPRSEKAITQEKKLKIIEKFLRNPIMPAAMPKLDQNRFIKSISEFFVLDNKLWRKDRQGRHKLVVKENRRFEIIRQAHDELGHKGIFMVRQRLGERFWWPHMDDNVKWFVQTCHECQIRLVKKIQISPTAPTPAGLLGKVYINTMLMPKAKGYRYIIHARCSLTSFPEWTMVKNENFKTISKFI